MALHSARNVVHALYQFACMQARFVERFAMGSPFSGGTINGPPFASLSEKVSWVEKFVQVRPALLTAAHCTKWSFGSNSAPVLKPVYISTTPLFVFLVTPELWQQRIAF